MFLSSYFYVSLDLISVSFQTANLAKFRDIAPLSEGGMGTQFRVVTAIFIILRNLTFKR